MSSARTLQRSHLAQTKLATSSSYVYSYLFDIGFGPLGTECSSPWNSTFPLPEFSPVLMVLDDDDDAEAEK